MGGKAKTEKTTAVTTETNTEIGDIGLTGQNAVDLATVLQLGQNDREAINSQFLTMALQEQGKTFRTLVGGAGGPIRTGVGAIRAPPTAGGAVLANASGFGRVALLAAIAIIPFILFRGSR